ncbi:hypothetical protein L289_1896 [Acinetobacter gerneri DSM 14967 = CIP 107464 = MTCC 9824]|nr:hypothetical protein L289_1896 [Acinetobacter gerneri DSM 14967 = CIP 107464 = MTCC 9824]
MRITILAEKNQDCIHFIALFFAKNVQQSQSLKAGKFDSFAH